MINKSKSVSSRAEMKRDIEDTADAEVAARAFLSENTEILEDFFRNNASSVTMDESGRRVIQAPVRHCNDGPIRVLHRDGNVFYWPPIVRRTCNGLFCPDPECIARSKEIRTANAFVFRIITLRPFPVIVLLGVTTVTYEDHLKCSCRTCYDITDFRECNCQERCPNLPFFGFIKESYCMWRERRVPKADPPAFIDRLKVAPGSCSCCRVPFFCLNPRHVFSRVECRCRCCNQQNCPCDHVFDQNRCECVCRKNCTMPMVLDPTSCKCVCPTSDCPPRMERDPKTCECKCERRLYCPPPSVLNKTTCECVGNCSEFSGSDKVCSSIRCIEDPNRYCRNTNGTCECPERCEDIRDRERCLNSVCPDSDPREPRKCIFRDDVGCLCPELRLI